MALDQVISVGNDATEPVLKQLADWAGDVSSDWPELALERAAHAFGDTVACMIAGADDASPANVRRGVSAWGSGPSSVAGQTEKLPAPWAAMANGTAAHALDYDDNVQVVLGHTSAVQVPALLALGEAIGAKS